ncbi:MAG: hypothetical protein K2X77_15595 [Candidatus Obscuribacterales bacterium]|jgi:hypothetical protein|nr:hypothetical protein [Candidatus Obscuribacterales bacterium]
MNIAIEYEDTIQSMMSLGVRCAASADRAAELYRMIRYRKINRRVAAREVRAIERHLDDLLRHIADLTNRFRSSSEVERPTLELVKGAHAFEHHQPQE